MYSTLITRQSSQDYLVKFGYLQPIANAAVSSEYFENGILKFQVG